MGMCVCGVRAEEGGKLCERCASLQILGLDARATHDETRAAYRVLARALQGDQFQEDETLREAAATTDTGKMEAFYAGWITRLVKLVRENIDQLDETGEAAQLLRELIDDGNGQAETRMRSLLEQLLHRHQGLMLMCKDRFVQQVPTYR